VITCSRRGLTELATLREYIDSDWHPTPRTLLKT